MMLYVCFRAVPRCGGRRKRLPFNGTETTFFSLQCLGQIGLTSPTPKRRRRDKRMCEKVFLAFLSRCWPLVLPDVQLDEIASPACPTSSMQSQRMRRSRRPLGISVICHFPWNGRKATISRPEPDWPGAWSAKVKRP